jgi:hypothetical protein
MDGIDENLSRITSVLRGNAKAVRLANDLWDFFEAGLVCTIKRDDGEPNEFRLDGIESPNVIGDIRFVITLRQTDRLEEGLVHELLHANLIALGYPTYWLSEQERFRWICGRDILNLAAHQVMQPAFVSLGYAEDRFVGPHAPLGKEGERVVADLDQMDLSTPESFGVNISAYLHKREVAFELVRLADVLEERRRRH